MILKYLTSDILDLYHTVTTQKLNLFSRAFEVIHTEDSNNLILARDGTLFS